MEDNDENSYILKSISKLLNSNEQLSNIELKSGYFDNNNVYIYVDISINSQGDGYIRQTYANKKLYQTISYYNGYKNGYLYTFRESGKLKSKVFYFNNRISGVVIDVKKKIETVKLFFDNVDTLATNIHIYRYPSESIKSLIFDIVVENKSVHIEADFYESKGYFEPIMIRNNTKHIFSYYEDIENIKNFYFRSKETETVAEYDEDGNYRTLYINTNNVSKIKAEQNHFEYFKLTKFDRDKIIYEVTHLEKESDFFSNLNNEFDIQCKVEHYRTLEERGIKSFRNIVPLLPEAFPTHVGINSIKIPYQIEDTVQAKLLQKDTDVSLCEFYISEFGRNVKMRYNLRDIGYVYKIFYDDFDEKRYSGDVLIYDRHSFNEGKDNIIFEYYPNGKIKNEYEIRNNILIKNDSYNEDGSKAVVSSIKKINGKTELVIQAYYENKEFSFINRYIDGKYDGEQIFFHPNGSISRTVNYKNGVREGLQRSLDQNGVIISELLYEKDSIIHAKYYENGVITREIIKTGDTKETIDYKNGNIYIYEKSIGDFVKNRREYDDNGILALSEIHYQNDPILKTIAFEYDEEGRVENKIYVNKSGVQISEELYIATKEFLSKTPEQREEEERQRALNAINEEKQMERKDGMSCINDDSIDSFDSLYLIFKKSEDDSVLCFTDEEITSILKVLNDDPNYYKYNILFNDGSEDYRFIYKLYFDFVDKEALLNMQRSGYGKYLQSSIGKVNSQRMNSSPNIYELIKI